MHDAQRIREALQAYMARHGIKPHRWSLDAGLSERTLPHFLDGHSKSLSPQSLDKLAKARGGSIVDILGFVPAWVKPESDAEGQGPEMVRFADVVGMLAKEMRELRQEVRELKEALRGSAGVPPAEKP